MTQRQLRWHQPLQFLLIGGILCVSSHSAIAQLRPIADDTLGNERSLVTPFNPAIDLIDGGARRGANLFHSFREFNVDVGRGVYFTNPAGVANILTRVTGGNPSQILGTLGVLGNANLFLMNPNGILFGANARLDLRGSFVASTANSFKFPDGSEFSATTPQAPPLLSINVPLGLQFGTIPAGSVIANRGNLTTGQDLILEADRLDLQGQLVAGRDLTLKAQDTVTARDSPTIPFVASAGRNLLIQGNQGVDISTLNHPNSGFWSGGNLVLRSQNPVVGDAHFFAGSNFQVEQLDGSAGDLLSPHDPIILTNGDVTLGDYTGASLHILAGGSVTLGNVTIAGTGTAATTINPSNTTLFNGSRTYADLANFNLTDYKATLNSDGSVRSVDPVLVPISINGSTQATLDVRAGVDWATLGGLPTSPVVVGVVTPAPTATGTASSANITLNGNIRVAQPAGLVLLTNQFRPNTLPGTIVIRGNVNTSTGVSGANGGDIRVYGQGDIAVIGTNPFNPLRLDAYSRFDSGTAGNGGTISLATSGNITLTNSRPFSYSRSDSGNAGNGGIIAFATNSGNITLTNSNSNSYSYTNSGTTGRGGAISFASNAGSINLTGSDSNSYSRSDSGNAGNGGIIAFATNSGNITLTNSYSYSYSYLILGNAGNGGAISFATNSGNISLIDSDLDSSSASSTFSESFSILGNAGNGGAISFATTSGNISLTNLFSYSDSRSDSGTAGNGGAVSLATTSGNISSTYWWALSSSRSLFNNAGNGGSISLTTTSGNISLLDSVSNSYSSTDPGIAGNGGSISFTTTSGNISLINSGTASLSVSGSGTAGNGGPISFTTNAGNIFLATSSVRTDSTASLRPTSGTAGKGGNISLTTTSGNISLADLSLSSYSYSYSGNAGSGGAIRLSAKEGSISGSSALLNSFSVSRTGGGGSGNGGKVTLEAGREISGLEVTTVASDSLAGDVEVNGSGNLRVVNTRILTAQQVEVCFLQPCVGNELAQVNLNDRGQAGNVTVTSAGSLTFSNSQIESDTRGGNPAGDITVRANQGITLADSSSITARTSSSGKAGNITFNAPTLLVAGDSQVLAETASTGDSGSIFVNAPISVDLRRVDNLSPVLSVEASGSGQAGNITINTPGLTLSEQARITATATATATNPQGGGSVTLNASNLNLAGIVGVFAETQGQSPAGTLRLNPYRNQPDLDITLTPQSQISASTSGSGRGGDLIVTAPQSITITGSGRLAVETSSTGNAGNINFTTQQLTLKDGVEISASTSGTGKAGEIGINAESFTLSGGANVSTNTFSSGSAGNITVQVNDRLFLTGRGTGLFASTAPGSSGIGGNITIDPRLVQVEDGATIAVDSQGRGTGGNISLQAGRLILNRQGSITAQTASAQGGNISLDVKDLLLLRRNSLISATAGTAQAGGDGGNITLNSKFVVAVANENSDISANAFTGSGGRVNITAQGLFGIQARPQLTPLSDITASSDFGIAGVVAISTPDLDPSRGLVQLPVDLTDASRLIVQTCPTGDGIAKQPNEFIITGRGGLPPTPSEAVNRDAIQVDLVTVDAGDRPSVSQRDPDPTRSLTVNPTIPSSDTPIVEAQALQIAADGTVFLVATAPKNPITPSLNRLIHCR